MDYGGRKTIERLQIRVPIVKNRLCQDLVRTCRMWTDVDWPSVPEIARHVMAKPQRGDARQ